MRRILLFAAIASFGIVAVPAAASPPEATTIVIKTVVPTDGSAVFGPFTATGDILCPSGATIDVRTHAAGGQSGSRLQLLVVKRFTCADGSGSFDLLIRVHLAFDPWSDVATWNVVGGTGDYERLRGSGSLVGVQSPNGVLDVLSGQLHVD